jgi:hypothetical protein
MMHHNWLVVYLPSEKCDFVSWGYYSQYDGNVLKFHGSKSPTRKSWKKKHGKNMEHPLEIESFDEMLYIKSSMRLSAEQPWSNYGISIFME